MIFGCGCGCVRASVYLHQKAVMLRYALHDGLHLVHVL